MSASRALGELPCVIVPFVWLGIIALSAVGWGAALAARLREAEARRQADGAQRDALALRSAGRLYVEASRRSTREVYDALERALRSVANLDAVLIFEQRDEALHCVHARGAGGEYYEGLTLPIDGESLAARAAYRGCALTLAESSQALAPAHRWALSVPLACSRTDRVVAYVGASWTPDAAAASMLTCLLEDAAAALALARERERDRSEAIFDGLTGLLTPRAFRAEVRRRIERLSLVHGAGCCLWFVDTDEFKSVNDRLGHAAGDVALQGIAAVLRGQATGGMDIVARNGGDEFCVLLGESRKSVAVERAGRACAAVRVHDFCLGLRLTASIGVACFPSDALDGNMLLERADAAMYHAKHHGRDRVAFYLERDQLAVMR
ncbi:MAG: GGDEF domain-containing protein [Vulcanimicrobiaceae bacterium]